MRSYYQKFKVDGQPILAPDQGMPISRQDLDAEGSGRDELGYMHRIVLRERVNQWQLNYSSLKESEFDYMDGLFEKKPQFKVEIVKGNKTIETTAYCSSVKAALFDDVKGIYKGVSYSIIEC